MEKKTGSVKKKANIIKNNLVLLKYILKFAPEMFVWKLFAVIMIMVSDISFNILFIKKIIDGISDGLQFEIVLFYIAGLALVRILCDLANVGFNQFIEPVARLKLHKGIYNLIYEKIEKIDLEKFDDASFYNDYIWALNEVDGRAKNTFNVLMQFIQCILNITTYSILSIMYDKFVLVFVIVPVAVNTIVGVRRAKVSYQFVSDLTPVNRKRDYSRRAFYLQQYAKEIKASQIGGVLRRNFNVCVDESIRITKKYRPKLFGMTYCETHAGWMFAKVFSAAYMSYKVLVAHAYTVGIFVVVYQAIGTFTNSLLSLFSIIPKLQENGLFAGRLLKIINYESSIETETGEVEIPKDFQCLELRNLTFQYPNSDKAILKGINLTIRKGEKIALAGLNGAGKTTLVKLIMRLYDPTEGCILMDGIDIRKFDIREYRAMFSSIFQDYQLFAVKLVENIYMRETVKEENEKAAAYLQQSRLEGFDDKMECNITKEFDKEGIVFSGGQAQKVAIARAFAKDGEFVIMDEASSALDPIAEAEIYNIIMKEMRKKSMVIISHRLSAIQNVDKIFYIQDGEIVESGSHYELLELDGKYAEMYKVQAEKYRDG